MWEIANFAAPSARRYSDGMKVEVVKQPGSVSTLHIELAPDEVSREWEATASSFMRFARIPGYRRGKAPRSVIEKRFRREIQDELTRKLVSRSYHQALEQTKLRVASLTNIEEVQFGEDKSMRFRVTVVTVPDFELPDYKSIPVELPETEVIASEIDAALERLRDQAADFVDAPGRPLQMGDFAVLDFEGVIDGQPIREIAPQASRSLHGGQKFWLHVTADNFLPKFCEQLVGQNRGETRLVIVDFPQDFTVKELAGKKADYTVTLREIKEKKLPELNDDFAAKLAEGKSLAELRQMIEHELTHEKQHELERAKETQILKYLHEQTQLEPPPLLLQNETRRALADLVQRNRDRGVPDDVLKEKEKELVEAAAGIAAHRLKTNFILERVAEREKIQVSPQELDARIRQEAARYDMPVEKMRKQLEEHNGLSALTEQILLGKTLAFLKANVSVKKRAVDQET